MNVDRRNEILEIIFKKLEAANRWGCEEVGTIYDFEKFELKILQTSILPYWILQCLSYLFRHISEGHPLSVVCVAAEKFGKVSERIWNNLQRVSTPL